MVSNLVSPSAMRPASKPSRCSKVQYCFTSGTSAGTSDVVAWRISGIAREAVIYPITGIRSFDAGSLLRQGFLDDADDRHEYAAANAAAGNAADDAADIHFSGSGSDSQHPQQLAADATPDDSGN